MTGLHIEALYESAWSGASETLQFLLRTTRFERSSLLNAFDLSCTSGSLKSASVILEHKPNFRDLCEGILIASGHGYVDIVRLLIDRLQSKHFLRVTLGGIRRGKGQLQKAIDRALNIASLNGHAKVVSVLLHHGADPNIATLELPVPGSETSSGSLYPLKEKTCTYQRTSLQAALEGYRNSLRRHIYSSGWREADTASQEATVLTLLEHGADANKSGHLSLVPLHTAIKHCLPNVVKALLDRGALLNDFPKEAPETEDGISLLDTGPELPLPDISTASRCDSSHAKKSVLEVAAGRELGSADILRVLLQGGAKLPHDYPNGRNPVLNAALEFFRGGNNRSRYDRSEGRFKESKSIRDILRHGPGGVIKTLLRLLPSEKAGSERYNLLLQMSIRAKDAECIHLLIGRGMNLDVPGYHYGTPLQCAARIGDIDNVELLLRSGADVNVVGGEYSTAIRAAVVGGHKKIVDVLLDHGADPNKPISQTDPCDSRAQSILHLSLRSPTLGLLNSLVAAGAQINLDKGQQRRVLSSVTCGQKKSTYCYDDEESSALHEACARGLEAAAQFLIDHGAEVDLEVEGKGRRYPNFSKTPLQVAVYFGHKFIVQLLLQSGAKLDHYNYHGSALSIASAKNRISVVEELLFAGAPIADPSSSLNALREACRFGHHEVIGLLLEELQGSAVEEFACSGALSSAASIGDDDTFKQLLDYIDDANLSLSMLSQACAGSLPGSVAKLLEHGLDVNGKLEEDEQAIHVAAVHQDASIMETYCAMALMLTLSLSDMEVLYKQL